MAALSAGLVCALCVRHGALTHCPQRFATDIARAAHRFALPETWICAVILAESGGRLSIGGGPVVSTAGAMGLMQLLPGTFAAMAARYSLGPDPFAPRANIFAGAAYLHRCYMHFGFPLLFAAYEAGPARVRALLLKAVPLSSQTERYVARILDTLPNPLTVTDLPAPGRTGSPAGRLFVGIAARRPLFFAPLGPNPVALRRAHGAQKRRLP